MDDVLPELRRLAAQATPAAPYVRVTGDLLIRAAEEIAASRRREAEATAMLFDPNETKQERTVL